MTPAELRKVLKENIRNRRVEKNMTQADLAAECDIAQATVAQYENGSKIPSLDTLIVLAEALSTTPHALISPEVFSGTST